MLLSPLNWVIHISSSLEWAVALVMLYRYGKMIGREDIRRFAICMVPHWIGSLFVLGYHLSGDTIPSRLEMSEAINLVGSIALLYATLKILNTGKQTGGAYTGLMLLGGLLLNTGPRQSFMGNTLFDAILQVSSVVYMTFLVLLLKVRKRDPEVFSGLTVAGFWFVLVFISVTVGCIWLATDVMGYQSLSHDDLLHGTAESLLTISNLMIVLGIHRQMHRAEAQGLSNAR